MISPTEDPKQSPPAQAMPPDGVIMQLLFGKIVAFSISGIARLGVADHISDEPRPVEEIAAASATHAPSLYRVLRMLASVGVFVEHPERKFALNAPAHLLRGDSPRSLRNMATMFADEWHAQGYQHIADSIRTGRDAVTAAFGKQLFDLFREIPDQAATFHSAMTDYSRLAADAVLQVADFSRFKRMADVGGGHGFLLGRILERFSRLEGVLFDLPEVVEGAKTTAHFEHGNGRVEFESGSFFDRVPERCDAYIMKFIVHDWNDESSRRVLSLMRDQLAATDRANGRVFLVEMVVPDGPEPATAKMLDIEMLVATRGGRERTATEFADLFNSAGLELVKISPTPSPVSLIEARYAN